MAPHDRRPSPPKRLRGALTIVRILGCVLIVRGLLGFALAGSGDLFPGVVVRLLVGVAAVAAAALWASDASAGE